MNRVSKSEFRIRAHALMRSVQETGTPLIVTDRGKPVIELRAIRSPRDDALDLLRGSVLYYERPFDPVGDDDWEALSEP
jgi:prevent-host-death family protein